MISIVMPTWNRREFLPQTIEGVLNQTYKDFEFIIIDDGSTDGSIELIEDYAKKDKRIRVIKKIHTGGTETFNTGFKAAKGDVICPLGSDDVWLTTKLEEQVKVAKDYPNHIIHNYSISINEKNEILNYQTFPICEDGDYKKIALGNPTPWFVTSSWFIPRKIFDEVGYFQHFYEDYDWIMRATLLHNVKQIVIPKFLTLHRTNPKSNTISDIGQKRFAEMAKEIQNTMIKRLEERKL